jgi:peptidyl-tRNA hydrolase, PTH1 family
MADQLHLIVGLGNPGPKYARNRHNIGFLALDAIARRWNAKEWKPKFQGEMTDITVDGQKILLLKPQTYMNESGRSVGEAMRFHKIPLGQIWVFHDELDLAPAKLRAKLGGGNAGHNGLRSISAHCGNDYPRIRMGIGHPGNKDAVHSYVLNDFAKAEEGWVEDMCRLSGDLLPSIIKNDGGRFQSDIALEMNRRGWNDVSVIGTTKAQQ